MGAFLAPLTPGLLGDAGLLLIFLYYSIMELYISFVCAVEQRLSAIFVFSFALLPSACRQRLFRILADREKELQDSKLRPYAPSTECRYGVKVLRRSQEGLLRQLPCWLATNWL